MSQPHFVPISQPSVKLFARRPAALVLAGCALILLLAQLLPPDSRGYGTHTRLLLPPCTFKLLTGLPCPFCGMTTGFAALAHGEWQAALRANIGAPLLYLTTWALGLAALWGLISNRPWLPLKLVELVTQRFVVTGLLVLWTINLLLHWFWW